MFKIRSIGVRLILAIALTVAAACAILGTFSILQQRSLTRMALDQQLKLQYDSVIAAIDYEGRATLAVSSVVAALPPVGDAIARGDRAGLAALLGDAMTALKAQGIPLITFQIPPATVFYRVHEPKIFGDDISGRRNTVVEATRTGKSIVGVEPGREALSIFGMTPIVRDGKTLANTDVGAAFGKEFVERAKKRFGIDLAVHSWDGKALKKLSSTFGDAAVATETDLKGVIDGPPLRRDATLSGRPAALYVGQIKNYAGQPVGILEVIKDTTEYEAAAASAQRDLILATIGILAVAVLLAFLLGRGLSRPLTAITAVMNRLARGETGIAIPGSERRDEVGSMAAAVDVFRRSMIEANSLRRRRRPKSSARKPRRRRCSARWPTASKPTSRAWSAPSRRQRRTCSAWPARSRPASTAPPNAPQPLRQLPRKHRPASARWPQQRKRRHPRSARSAARSPIPQKSPTTPWRRPGSHGNGWQPRQRRRKDRRRAAADQHHCQPDQPAGAQRHHRGGARR
jgi:methyl-accepting chemotaxis protein